MVRDPRLFRYLGSIPPIGLGLVALRILTGDQPELVLHGAFDEVGHLLTALLIAIGLRGRRPSVNFWAILLGGVILDLGHVTDILGLTASITGSSRNGSHSLFVVALIAALALLDRRRAPVWLALAVGALTHLWRDLGTGYVALAWPFSDRVWGVSFVWYVGVLVTLGMLIVLLPRRSSLSDPGSLGRFAGVGYPVAGGENQHNHD